MLNIKVRFMVITLMIMCVINGFLLSLVMLDFIDIIELRWQFKLAFIISLIIIPVTYKLFKSIKVKVKIF